MSSIESCVPGLELDFNHALKVRSTFQNRSNAESQRTRGHKGNDELRPIKQTNKGMPNSKFKRIIISVMLLSGACQIHAQTGINQGLIQTLDSMAILDQRVQNDLIANKDPQKKDSLSRKEFEIFGLDCMLAKKIFSAHGFPGYNHVGKQSSFNYWLIIQHCDNDPEFQSLVLDAMKVQVLKGNASGSNYAYLLDRVKINTGQKQIYGTQVSYDDNGNAYPKNFENWDKVDEMRSKAGLDSLKTYLNRITQSHLGMNPGRYKNRKEN